MISVLKKNQHKQAYTIEKIRSRLSRWSNGLSVNIDSICDQISKGIFDGIQTHELESLLQQTTAYMSTRHPNYSLLAGRLAATNLHKSTKTKFSEAVEILHKYHHPKTNEAAPLVSDQLYQIVQQNKHTLDCYIDDSRDFNFEYFGFMTLSRGYLLKVNEKIVERPQYMFMRVSIGIHGNDIASILETYDLLSMGYFTHASPTLFNSGTPRPQMSSCFLVHMKDDSIEGIYDTLKTCANISKHAGGIGISVHNIRASNSYIRGTNGISNGLTPMLRVFNDTARYVDQGLFLFKKGGGKRKGSFAIYLEPWHADIYEFLSLKKNNGIEESRARDLFYALWIPDLFMRRVMSNGSWSLFCPNEAKGLSDCWGEEFEQLYQKYEKEGKARRVVKAQEIWFAILEAQQETGTPYMLYKDSCNRKSNQQNLGVIKSSNLCTEIIQFTSPDEVAVCNLGSVSLSKFVDEDKFNHDKLFDVVQTMTRNLNKVIDVNFYPVQESETSNKKHRPIGIGVQGLHDAFFKLKYPFDSKEAAVLNREIFETIYYAALTASKELAKKFGPYESYDGSPVSKGILQYDMWNITPSNRWDWQGLKEEIKKYGVRNSLLLAPMPTASTAQIHGNTESFEPVTSNMYVRRVLSGEFPVINSYLVNDLIKLKLWDNYMINKITAENGSIQNIDTIPQKLKNIYKTVWEIKQKVLIDMSIDRAAFIDQSQSLNCYMADPTIAKLSSMHFYAWNKGAKTGMYYLRRKPKASPTKFTVDQELLNSKSENTEKKDLICNKGSNDESCLMCSS